MKVLCSIFIILVLVTISCKTSPMAAPKVASVTPSVSGDTIRIANEELEYEVIIIDPGFNTWLAATALPRGFYSQDYLENKNQFYVNEWNQRVMQPQRFNPNLYEMTINYDPNINYGYEVNYLIYNYMVYFQNTFKQTLYGRVPIR